MKGGAGRVRKVNRSVYIFIHELLLNNKYYIQYNSIYLSIYIYMYKFFTTFTYIVCTSSHCGRPHVVCTRTRVFLLVAGGRGLRNVRGRHVSDDGLGYWLYILWAMYIITAM
jgi:hypothetical protein